MLLIGTGQQLIVSAIPTKLNRGWFKYMSKAKLELHPSRMMAALLLFMHAGALGCVSLLKMPWWAHIAMAVFFVVSFSLTYYHYVMLRSPKSIIRVSEEKDRWSMQTRAGQILRGEVLGDSVVTNLVVVLNFKVNYATSSKHKTFSVVVFADSVPASDFRRLKARLLFLRKHMG